MSLPELFSLEDYKYLNKDLYFETDKEYITHYRNNGSKQMRLINKEQLVINIEFGFEVTTYIPYYFYLFYNNLLFDNIIHTFNGMQPYYYFLPECQLETKRTIRCGDRKEKLLVNYDIPGHLDKRYWKVPEYKEYYKNNIFLYDKPLLIINNKYNIEWDTDPINFISAEILNELVTKLKDKYQIIYIRERNTESKKGISGDTSPILDGLYDYEILETHPEVITFNYLRKQYKNLSYNEIKCLIYANCDNYISAQGGGANILPYFACKTVILHKRGREITQGFYTGFCREAKPDLYENFIVCTEYDELVGNCEKIFLE
jgi:hypothetical protein